MEIPWKSHYLNSHEIPGNSHWNTIDVPAFRWQFMNFLVGIVFFPCPTSQIAWMVTWHDDWPQSMKKLEKGLEQNITKPLHLTHVDSKVGTGNCCQDLHPRLPNPWNTSTTGKPFANHLAWQPCDSVPNGQMPHIKLQPVFKTLCRHALAHSVSKCFGSVVSWNRFITRLHVTCPKSFDTGHWYQRMYESWNITCHLPAIASRFHGRQKGFALRKTEMVYASKQKWGDPSGIQIPVSQKVTALFFNFRCLRWVDPLARFDPVCVVAR